MKIFLSHVNRDKPLVREFRQCLPRILDTWLDEDNLSWGDSFPDNLEHAIKYEVDFLIMFLDGEALKSKWVRKELKWGFDRERKLERAFVLPIIIEKISSENLPDEMTNRHFLELPNYSTDAIKTLADMATNHLFRFLAESFSTAAHTSAKTVILYMPLLNLNPFFSTFLEYFCEQAQFDGFDVVLKKGHSIEVGVDRSLHAFLEDVRDGHLAGSSIVLFPPHPDCFKELLKPERIKEFSDLNVVIMDIDPCQNADEESILVKKRLDEAEYIKAVIALDNRKACDMAARAIIDSVEGKFDYINVILCDGEYHGRGGMFYKSMCQRSSQAKKVDGSDGGIFVSYVPEYRQQTHSQNIRFASAFRDTNKYVRELLQDQDCLQQVMQQPTFIFCTNDVIAMGAKEALNVISDDQRETVTIIAYDGSSLLEGILDANDPYVRISLRQNYNEYVGTLATELRMIVSKQNSRGEQGTSKIRYVEPDIRIESLNVVVEQKG